MFTGFMTTARLDKFHSNGLDVITLGHGGMRELFITVVPAGDADLSALFARAWGAVRAAGAQVVRQDVFGIRAGRDHGPAALRAVCGAVDWPVSWLEEGASLGAELTGTHLQAVSGVEVDRIRLDGEVVGTFYDSEYARYCRLGGIVPGDLTQSRERQARAVFEKIAAALAVAGMNFGHVARTWFYNDRILEWYREFNLVRDVFFREHGVFDGLVPASTGIGASNPVGAALVADALAVRTPEMTGVFALPSPLQCPALNYQSSFSRAVEIATPDHRRLLVSGTASIAPDGRTARVGDFRGQVELTLDVVEAILRSRQMDWANVTRAIAYVKHGQDAPFYRQVVAARGLPAFPTVVAENDICRDDLLFELELGAVAV